MRVVEPALKALWEKMSAHKLLTFLLLGFMVMSLVRIVSPAKNSRSMGMMRRSGAVYVELGQARFGSMREAGLYYGTLAAAKQFSVSSRVGGRLEIMMVGLGDRIESGQLLARVDAERFSLARDKAEQELHLAEAQYDEAQANLKLAQSDMERQSALAGKRITTQADLETTQNRLLQAEARLRVAESQLEAAGSLLANAELELSYTEINAEWPEGGHRFIGKKLVEEGDLLTANTPVLTVVSLDPLFLVVEVLEKDYPRIKIGQVAELRGEAWPGEVFPGRVTRIAPVLSAASRQARVELEVSNPDLKLKPGMFLEAVFVFNEVKDVWSVPQDVPFRQRDGFVIFIADPATNTVRRKPVVLGLAENGWVELIDSGPIENPVVFLAQHLLEDGHPYKLSSLSSPEEAETGETAQ